MSCDFPSVSNSVHCPTASEIGAAPDAREGPPPLPILPGNCPAVPGSQESPPLDKKIPKTALLRPPPLPVVEAPPKLDPEPIHAAWERIAAQPTAMFDTVKTDEKHTAKLLWQRCNHLLFLGVSRLLFWYREDGFWYISSMMIHAVGLFSLALISLAIPHAMTASLSRDVAPSFDAANVSYQSPMEIARFEVGD